MSLVLENGYLANTETYMLFLAPSSKVGLYHCCVTNHIVFSFYHNINSIYAAIYHANIVQIQSVMSICNVHCLVQMSRIVSNE